MYICFKHYTFYVLPCEYFKAKKDTKISIFKFPNNKNKIFIYVFIMPLLNLHFNKQSAYIMYEYQAISYFLLSSK